MDYQASLRIERVSSHTAMQNTPVKPEIIFELAVQE
jgi:hypothetical protein